MTRDFGDDVFIGAAKYYAEYRPKYPARLFDDIVSIFGLDGRGKLLDLGCGTGEMAIPLAKYFEQVLAIDPDAEMLAEGQAKAKNRGITNISWQKGSSKELNGLATGLRLVAMGQSFHWMDQETVLNELYERIDAGGGVAIVGTDPIEQEPEAATKDQIIQTVLRKYLGPERRAGDKTYTHPNNRYEDLLPNSKFSNFTEHYYDVVLSRSIDQIIGNLYSMSWAAKKLFGSQIDDFDAELRRELEQAFTANKVTEKKRFILYTVSK